MERVTRRALGPMLFLLVASAGAQDSTRGVRIGLRYDPGHKPGVVILPIAGPLADSMRAILERDFDFSDRVTVVAVAPEDGSILAGSSAPGTAAALNYPLFARLGAAGVLQITPTSTGMHVAVHDVERAGVATVRDFPLPRQEYSPEWRMAVHGIADAVHEMLTGQRGASQTRITFARNRGIWVIDFDGHGVTEIPVVGEALSPAWHPSGTVIAYNTYGIDSRVVVHDLTTGKSRDFGSQRNAGRLTPVFTPDGRFLVYALSTESGTDLYQVPLEGEAFPRRMTFGRGSRNWAPSFHPDGMRLAFGSDRLGPPQVHIMDADGTNVQIFTNFDFGDQNDRTGPDWSPDGRQIAFQSRIDGRYQIFTMNLRDRQPRQLTSEGENEDPSWSPDGRHLVFVSTRTGVNQLWVLDTESGRLRQLTQAGGARVPAWSPRLGGR